MKVTLSLHICGCRFAHIPHTAWWGLAGSNRRPPACERACNGTFRLKQLFPPLYARKATLFGTLISIVSKCSETVNGQACGHFCKATLNMNFRFGIKAVLRFFCPIINFDFMSILSSHRRYSIIAFLMDDKTYELFCKSITNVYTLQHLTSQMLRRRKQRKDLEKVFEVAKWKKFWQ